jgi:hypothetical protein
MAWIDDALERLAATPVCDYVAPLENGSTVGATEPTALAALALAMHGRVEPGGTAADWLVAQQETLGCLGVRPGEPTPRWPTSLAVLAWQAIDAERFHKPLAAAVQWALSVEGERLQSEHTSHDSMLAGWPWVDGTHSWV